MKWPMKGEKTQDCSGSIPQARLCRASYLVPLHPNRTAGNVQKD